MMEAELYFQQPGRGIDASSTNEVAPREASHYRGHVSYTHSQATRKTWLQTATVMDTPPPPPGGDDPSRGNGKDAASGQVAASASASGDVMDAFGLDGGAAAFVLALVMIGWLSGARIPCVECFAFAHSSVHSVHTSLMCVLMRESN